MSGTGKSKTAIKFYWAWQDEREEKWLEQMARQGWHLKDGGILFHFLKGEPGEFLYRLDYRPESKRDLDEYLALFRDSGWEHVCSYVGWHYFRTNNAAAPEIFTDVESRIAKYRRLLGILVLFIGSSVAVFSSSPSDSSRVGQTLYKWVCVGQSGLVILLAYAAVRLLLHIHRLQQKAAQSRGC